MCMCVLPSLRASLPNTDAFFYPEGALYYDYFLTLEDEIRLVWNTPFSAATVLYLIIRYGVLIDMALGMVLIVRTVWS